MKVLRHTLISEGPTDANLIPILDWTLREAGNIQLSQGVRAEFWRLPEPPGSLVEKIAKSQELFPCDVLFMHRDADREPDKNRHDEIRGAVEKAIQNGFNLPAVAVVPVRMLEAWLLFDEIAIRNAAGNPNGRESLTLPSIHRIEALPDPKIVLRDALKVASGLTGRRLRKFRTSHAFWRVVDYMEDFSPLRHIPAFQRFEDSVKRMALNGWKPGFYGL